MTETPEAAPMELHPPAALGVSTVDGGGGSAPSTVTIDDPDWQDVLDEIADECKWSDWTEVRDRTERILRRFLTSNRGGRP